MNIATTKLMNDAIRRYCMFYAGEPLSRAWVGLGTASVYRPAIEAGLMTFHDGKMPPKRCMGWLVLTEKGQSVFMKTIAEHMKTHYNMKSYSNNYELFPS